MTFEMAKMVVFLSVLLMGCLCSADNSSEPIAIFLKELDESLQIDLLEHEINFKYEVETQGERNDLFPRKVFPTITSDTNSLGQSGIKIDSTAKFHPAPTWQNMNSTKYQPFPTWASLTIPTLPSLKPLPAVTPIQFPPMQPWISSPFAFLLNQADLKLAYPASNIPTWAPFNHFQAPVNSFQQHNYTWAIPTFAPLKPFPLYPAYHPPTYWFKTQRFANLAPRRCPIHYCSLRHQQLHPANDVSSGELGRRPQSVTNNLNNIIRFGGESTIVNQPAPEVVKKEPRVTVEKDSIDLGSTETLSLDKILLEDDTLSMENDLLEDEMSATQIFEVGNTKTANSISGVLLGGNCGRKKLGGICGDTNQGQIDTNSLYTMKAEKVNDLMTLLLQSSSLSEDKLSSTGIEVGNLKSKKNTLTDDQRKDFLPSLYSLIPFVFGDTGSSELNPARTNRAHPDTPAIIGTDGSESNLQPPAVTTGSVAENSLEVQLRAPTNNHRGRQMTIPGSVGVADSQAAVTP